MATTTTNYGLTKPAGTEKYDISVPNANMDKIDTQMKANATAASEAQTLADEALSTAKDKQNPVKAGTGISIGTDGVTIGHSNSVKGRSVGSETLMPIITFDNQGHITEATSTPVYPPTSKGTANQYWRADGDGPGAWTTPATTPTDTDERLISAKGVYNALQDYGTKDEVESAQTKANEAYTLADSKQKAITVSTVEPTASDGANGDFWAVYE